MTTTTNPHCPPTAVPCPDWCEIDHTNDMPGAGFHRSANFNEGGGFPVMLWLGDHPGERPGVLAAAEVLSGDDAHELGLALVRAGARLRQVRINTTGACECERLFGIEQGAAIHDLTARALGTARCIPTSAVRS